MNQSQAPKSTFSLKKNWPLVSLILIAALAATALMTNSPNLPHAWMHFFMGVFLCQFSMLKIFNLSSFADGFQMYDLIAMKSRIYAFVYPFLELGLGLAYLAFFLPYLTYILTIVILGVGAIGVIKALKKGLDIRCACMGTVLDVPLSTVTLTEDVGMVLMAVYLLF